MWIEKRALDIRGFKGVAYQESCQVLGDADCTWTIKKTD